MAVTVDATATAPASSPNTAVTTLTNSSLTVGAGATALLAVLVFNEFSVIGTPGTVKWDNAGTPQTMTLLARIQTANANLDIMLYGLVNPTPGNKNLTATWTGAVPAILDAQSYNGTITTSVATAFLHAATNSGVSGSPALTITSATGNMVAAVAGSTGSAFTGLTATGSSAIYTNQSFGSSFGSFRTIASVAPGASTVTWTGAPTSTEWGVAGVDIVAGSTGITGTLSVTEGNDTLAAAGTVPVVGTLSRTEASDTLSAAGGVLVSGTLSRTEANDTLSASGGVLVSGTLSATEANDTLSATGIVATSPTGTLSVTEANDTLVAAGWSTAVGALSKTEANDTISSAGTVLVSGTLSRTEANDTLTSVGTVLVSGGLTVTEQADARSLTGTVSGGTISGHLTITEANDRLAIPSVPQDQLGISSTYTKGVLPLITGGAAKFSQRQFDQLGAVITHVLLMAPQSATEAPVQLFDGMQRLARAPWRPVAGQTADAWVYWDGAAQIWRLKGGTAPSNTSP